MFLLFVSHTLLLDPVTGLFPALSFRLAYNQSDSTTMSPLSLLCNEVTCSRPFSALWTSLQYITITSQMYIALLMEPRAHKYSAESDLM